MARSSTDEGRKGESGERSTSVFALLALHFIELLRDLGELVVIVGDPEHLQTHVGVAEAHGHGPAFPRPAAKIVAVLAPTRHRHTDRNTRVLFANVHRAAEFKRVCAPAARHEKGRW